MTFLGRLLQLVFFKMDFALFVYAWKYAAESKCIWNGAKDILEINNWGWCLMWGEKRKRDPQNGQLSKDG